MSKFTEAEVMKALSKVEDPDLKKDLVTLNMIKNVDIGDKRLRFTLMLTTPACPLKEYLKSQCTEAIHNNISKDIQVDIDLDSQVMSSRQDNQEMLSGIKNIIGVASGKGGVGKSTIAVNLALALARMNAKTGILDADVHGPSVPSMLGIDEMPGAREEGEKTILEPIERHNVKVMSMGMLIGYNQPLVWRGPMVSSALRQMMVDVEWGDLDYLILDLPPGTGDIHLTLAQQFPLSGAVLVTTPQQVAVNDTRKTIEMFRSDQINTPVLGLVENMSWFSPKELPENKYYLFGKDGGKHLAEEYELPLLGQIPLFMRVGEESEKGNPAVVDEEHYIRKPFMDMSGRVAQEMVKLNAEILKAV